MATVRRRSQARVTLEVPARDTHEGEGDSDTIVSVSGGPQRQYRRRQRHPDEGEQANVTRGGVRCYFETFPTIIQ